MSKRNSDDKNTVGTGCSESETDNETPVELQKREIGMSTETMRLQASQTKSRMERESLACLPSRFAWTLATLFAGALIVDVVGSPKESATLIFMLGLFLGAVGEASADLIARRKLNFQDIGPFFSVLKVLSSLHIAAGLALLALIFGDAALQNLGDYAIGLGVVFGMIGASRGRVPTLTVQNVPGETAAFVETGRALTESDRQMAAFHEAGHALSLAMVPKSWREGAFVQIGDSKTTFTHAPRDEALWKLAVFRRWEMMMLLAGPVATDRSYGSAMEGGASDMREWRYKAMSVLTADRAEGWVIDPADELEYENNQRLLKALEREQTEALNEFFAQNQAAYEELVLHIFENSGADPEALDRLLAPVTMGPKLRSALGV